jgi:hypothetical protein
MQGDSLKRIWLIAALMLTVGMRFAHADTVHYEWSSDSDGEVAGSPVLGTYGTIDVYINSDSQAAYSEEHSLKIVDGGSGTPQAFVGWVPGLNDGDQVTAGFWVYDDSPGAQPSARIYGHYTDDLGDINSYSGSASGNLTYSGTNTWSYLEHTWTFNGSGGDNGLVIEVRSYGGLGDVLYIDSLTITAPNHATINVPTP